MLDTVGKTADDNLRFYFKDLTDKQMTDNVYVRAYADVGGTALYSETVKFSVLEYAHVQLNNPSATPELKALLTDMLNYGASAQKYFDYNTYRPVYTAAQTGYNAVANDWFHGSYNGSLTAWAGESHTVGNPTRLTFRIFTLKAGQTITVTCPQNVTMTNGISSPLMVAYTLLTPVEGSNTGDIFTDYTTSGKATWSKTYTNTTENDVLIVFMLKPNDGNGGLNLSNAALQETTITINSFHPLYRPSRMRGAAFYVIMVEKINKLTAKTRQSVVFVLYLFNEAFQRRTS